MYFLWEEVTRLMKKTEPWTSSQVWTGTGKFIGQETPNSAALQDWFRDLWIGEVLDDIMLVSAS